MFSMIVLIFYGIDRFISEYKTQVTTKERKEALDFDKEESSWNPSLV